MDSRREAYWQSEYKEFKHCFKNTKANIIYKRYAKQQKHKARRQHDKVKINNQLRDMRKESNKETNPGY